MQTDDVSMVVHYAGSSTTGANVDTDVMIDLNREVITLRHGHAVVRMMN